MIQRLSARNKIITGAAIIALCGTVAYEVTTPPTPLLIYNKSDSAPHGWYRVDPQGRIEKDVSVAAFAPDGARDLADERGYLPAHIPLIKTVWAVAGEEVCAENGVVSAPGRPDIFVKPFDSAGRAMPSWRGCITLQPGEIFLVSVRTETSFDSRYFGAIDRQNVLGTAHYLGGNQE